MALKATPTLLPLDSWAFDGGTVVFSGRYQTESSNLMFEWYHNAGFAFIGILFLLRLLLAGVTSVWNLVTTVVYMPIMYFRYKRLLRKSSAVSRPCS